MKKILPTIIIFIIISLFTVTIYAQPRFESKSIYELSRIKMPYNDWHIRTYCVDGYKFVQIFFNPSGSPDSSSLTQVFKNDNGKSVPETCK